MKHKLLIMVACFAMIANHALAQAPQTITFQAVARDSSGNFIPNQLVSLRFSIHEITAGGAVLYQETQTVTTNVLGLFVVNVGQGTVVTGTFSTIDWGGGSKFIQVELDPAGGSSYLDMGTQQMFSVPYALYSASSANDNNVWNKSGNAGTNSFDNFLGTTDNHPLVMKVNGIRSGYIDSLGGNSTTSFGMYAGANNVNGASNTFLGVNAGLTNISGGSNTFTGSNSGEFNNASNNSFYGSSAGQSNTTGSGNSFFGTSAGASNSASNNSFFGQSSGATNSSGFGNSFYGKASGTNNTTGFQNSFFGISSGLNNTDGSENAYFGSLSGNANNSGIRNSFYGEQSGQFTNGGSSNTFIGNETGTLNIGGSNNTLLGTSSNVTSGGLTNATAIGYRAMAGADNTVVIGSINGINGAGETAKVGIGTSTPGTRLEVIGKTKTDTILITTGAGLNKILVSDLVGNGTWQSATPAITNAWGITGNAGTADGANFIGTTDNIPLNFKVNNQKSGRIDYANPFNTFFGYQSGQSTSGIQNTGSGYQALGANSTGNNNTATGMQTLANNSSGSTNTAHGYQALVFNTTGNGNTALGGGSLFNNKAGSNGVAIGLSSQYYINNTISAWDNTNTSVGVQSLIGSTTPENNTGTGNTAIGRDALLGNSTGVGNTATGYLSLNANTTGIFNTAIGRTTLIANSIGNYNTAIGGNALWNNLGNNNTAGGMEALFVSSTGSNNTAFGMHALFGNGTGSNNTALGYQADVSAGGLTNATAVGANAIVSVSNALVLGNGAKVGIGTSSPVSKLDVRGSTSDPMIHGENNGTDITSYGVWGYSPSSKGVFGQSNSSYGVEGFSFSSYGVYGESDVEAGVLGFSPNTGVRGVGGITGVVAQAMEINAFPDRRGVYADGENGSNNNYGVYSIASGGTNTYGIYAIAGGGTNFNDAGYFSGDVFAFNYFTLSDRRFKNNIIPLSNALSIINQLKPSSYSFKTDKYKQMNLPEGMQYGLIADEVKDILPSAVKKQVQPAAYENHDGKNGKKISDEVEFYSVNYTEMIPILIGAVNEQQIIINSQDSKIDNLQKQIDELKAMIKNR